MSPIDEALQEGLTTLLVRCLRHLASFGIVTDQQLKGRFYIRWDRAFVLGHRRHGAATTQDDAGRAVVYLDPDQQVHQLAWCILHEATHVAQVCRGDMAYPKGGGVEWRGELVDPCAAQDPAYLEQPWEVEAEEMLPKLNAALRDSDPELGPILDVMEEHHRSL